jgi:hypothetical protein
VCALSPGKGKQMNKWGPRFTLLSLANNNLTIIQLLSRGIIQPKDIREIRQDKNEIRQNEIRQDKDKQKQNKTKHRQTKQTDQGGRTMT